MTALVMAAGSAVLFASAVAVVLLSRHRQPMFTARGQVSTWGIGYIGSWIAATTSLFVLIALFLAITTFHPDRIG